MNSYGSVPWRLVSLIREFSPKFNVLIPYKAMSAGSIFALGADEIVMHKLAALGPIDPSVANQFNPKDQQSGHPLPISVEDVKSYLSFAHNTADLKTAAGKIKALELLVTQVHPLALGNVERFISQARLVGEKVLRTHMDGSKDKKQIDDIIENMASKLYFHGHPINRKEARTDLKLSVCEKPPVQLENAMLELFLDYEQEFKMKEAFNPLAGLNSMKEAHTRTVRLAQAELAQLAGEVHAKNLEMQIYAQDASRLPQIQTDLQALGVKQGAAQARAQTPLDVSQIHELSHAAVESLAFSDFLRSKRNYNLATVATPMGQHVMINEEILEEGWSRSQA